MTDKETIITHFIANFVIKERRKRSRLELSTPERRYSFINRFNHNWEDIVQMKYLNKIEKGFADPQKIRELLGFKDTQPCYVISHYPDLDNQILTFADAFDSIYARGFASILMNLSATCIYLETEQSQGAPDRFTGKRNDIQQVSYGF